MRAGLRTALIIFTAVLGAAFFSVGAYGSLDMGSDDLDILNGGVMLTREDGLYYANGRGIYLESGGETSLLTAEAGRNLNYMDGALWYTLGGDVRRLPSGGTPETVYSHGAYIKQLYVLRDGLLLLSEGEVFFLGHNAGVPEKRDAPEDVAGLIPTEYGTLYLTGDIFDYELWAEDERLLGHVASCYTDGDYLVLSVDGETLQAELSAPFDGELMLEPLSLHDGEAPVIPAEEFSYDEYLSFLRGATPMNYLADSGEYWSPELSDGQENIVKRARQLMEIEWTPLEDVTQWGYYGTFTAGTTYVGIPYGQPVYTGYVGYKISLDQFLAAVNDNTSAFYTTYSQYNKIAPCYSCDCSGFVSYALGLKTRANTSSLAHILTKVGDQSLYSVQVGDCLDLYYSHAALITDVRYDESGAIVAIEVSEQTPVITQKTLFGQGGTKTLDRFQSYYLGGGYVIYRLADRDAVAYTHSCAVPIDGDFCESCAATVPWATVTGAVGSKLVALNHRDENAVIHYTTDGSEPTAASPVYSEPIAVYDTLTVRAIAVSADFPGSDILTCKVTVKPAGTPAASPEGGLMQGEYVSAGTKIALSSPSQNAELFYTTDGTTPTGSSRKYTAPIPVTGDITIKVFARALGCTDSETVSFTFRLGKTFTLTASSGMGGGISPAGETSILESGSQSYAIKPKAGYKIGDVLVDGASVGAVSEYTFSDIHENHTISASFRVDVTIPFGDVGAGTWYYDAVCYAYANSLFEGTSASAFSPELTMTRGMFVTVLGRMAGVDDEYAGGVIGVLTGSQVRLRSEPGVTGEILAVTDKNDAVQVLDVADDWYNVRYGPVEGYISADYLSIYSGALGDLVMEQYYSPHAQWASLTGILGAAVTDGIFNADMPVTREHMALLLYNYAALWGERLPTVVQKTVFTDDSQISASCKTAVYALQQAGIIDGMGDGSFAPQSGATRAQVAQIFMNYLNAVE